MHASGETAGVQDNQRGAVTSIDLLRHGLALDPLADGLKFSRDGAKVDVLAGVLAIANGDDFIKGKFRHLKRMFDIRRLNQPEYRFNLARLAAIHVLASARSDGALGPPVKLALDAFERAGRLGSSAVDVVAAAVLLPEPDFSQRCEAADHNIRTLAGEFELPMSAIALRQEVYHSRHMGESVNDCRDGAG